MELPIAIGYVGWGCQFHPSGLALLALEAYEFLLVLRLCNTFVGGSCLNNINSFDLIAIGRTEKLYD